MFQCRHCATSVPYDEPIPRDAECPGCGRDLRACAQCRHYDPAYHNACRETEADPVVDKDRRNFCEFFSFDRAPFKAAASGAKQAEARAKLEALFGGAGRPDPKGDVRKKLESLFERPDPEE